MPEKHKNFLEDLLDAFYNLFIKRLKSPRRADFIIWSIILWVCFLDDPERKLLLDSAINFESISLTPFPTLKPSVPVDSAIIVYKLLAAAIFSAISHFTLRFYFDSKFAELKIEPDKVKEVEELVHLLDGKAGIKKIFTAKRNSPIINQPYSSEILKRIPNSRNIKILCIAGYEFIGKGEGTSLLYDYFRQHWITADVILLNPENINTRPIQERLSQLKENDTPYSAEKLKKEISATADKIKTLKSIRLDGTVELHYCKFHPIFRLIILDDCLFMSTYECDLHGHEAPVYLIEKAKPEGLSLYNSFVNLFDNIKNHSEKIV